MTYPDVFSLTHAARSIRAFDPSRPIDSDTLRYLVDCARLTPSAENLQPLKYRIVEGDEAARILPLTRWAGYLKDKQLPPDGMAPSGYIVICHDLAVCERSEYSTMDAGIAAQTVNLAARERGFGTCMIGSFEHDAVAELLLLPRTVEPLLVIALGTPAEAPIICSLPSDGSTRYFRDDADLHFVPKRSLEEVLIK